MGSTAPWRRKVLAFCGVPSRSSWAMTEAKVGGASEPGLGPGLVLAGFAAAAPGRLADFTDEFGMAGGLRRICWPARRAAASGAGGGNWFMRGRGSAAGYTGNDRCGGDAGPARAQ